MITSPHNPRVKCAARLRDHGRRREERRILIDGTREIIRALTAGVALEEVFFCAELCQAAEARQLLEDLAKSGAEVIEVSGPVFARLAFGERAEGIVAVAAEPPHGLEDLRLRLPSPTGRGAGGEGMENPLVAVLEGVEKPGNLGAVLRSADAAGVSALISAAPRQPTFSIPTPSAPAWARSSRCPSPPQPAEEVLVWLREHRFSNRCRTGRKFVRHLPRKSTSGCRRPLSLVARPRG